MSRFPFSGRPWRVSVFIFGLLVAAASCGLRAESFTKGRDVVPRSPLKTGDYVWKPEVSPAGPVIIVVSIPEQVVHVYRNGVRIGRSTVSTGRPGHQTPAGVFTILEKQVKHESSIYKGASMPYMERLTWGGIALHAGQLPGYAASHGCIRLPLDFARKLYTVTGKGTTVIISNGETSPSLTGSPGYLLAARGRAALADNVGSDDFQWNPEQSPTGPISIIVSTKSSRIFVFRNGVEIGRAVIRGGEDLKLGIHAYSALDKFNSDGYRIWTEIDTMNPADLDVRDLMKHVSIPPVFLQNLRAVVQPGTTMVVSDTPVDRTEPVDTGVNILSTEPLTKK